MRFSERTGINPVEEKIIQINSMDEDLRNGLWNALSIFYWKSYESPNSDWADPINYVENSNLEDLIFNLWIHYFKQPIDSIEEYWESCLEELRSYFYQALWWEIYDFIEFVANNGEISKKKSLSMHVTLI